MQSLTWEKIASTSKGLKDFAYMYVCLSGNIGNIYGNGF